MKVIRILMILSATLLWASCGNQATDHHHHDGHDHGHDHDHSHEPAGSADGIHFGESIDETGALTYAELILQLQDKMELKDIKLTGTVSEVCQVKGCWMNIQPDTGDGMPVFVQFKDYAFAMPKDITGRKVVIYGKAFYEMTSVEDLRHYAEDEGASQAEIDAITEPKTKLKFTASGAKLL